jgi:hypothetical protein
VRNGQKSPNGALLPMLQKTNEMNGGIYIIFATNGYPKKFHIFQKINHRPK